MGTSTQVDSYASYKVRGDDNTLSEWTQYVRLSNQFVPERYNEIEISYSGGNMAEVVYKLDSVTVGTLTLTYAGGQLTKIVRS